MFNWELLRNVVSDKIAHSPVSQSKMMTANTRAKHQPLAYEKWANYPPGGLHGMLSITGCTLHAVHFPCIGCCGCRRGGSGPQLNLAISRGLIPSLMYDNTWQVYSVKYTTSPMASTWRVAAGGGRADEWHRGELVGATLALPNSPEARVSGSFALGHVPPLGQTYATPSRVSSPSPRCSMSTPIIWEFELIYYVHGRYGPYGCISGWEVLSAGGLYEGVVHQRDRRKDDERATQTTHSSGFHITRSFESIWKNKSSM